MNIPMNAKVQCTDGPCGESAALVGNPVTQSVTHVVVKSEQIRPPHERLVPVEKITETGHDWIRLACTKDELERMDPFVVTRYIQKKRPDWSGPYAGGEYHESPYAIYASEGEREEVERVPAGELAVHRGADVAATDGHIGTVGELVVEPTSGHITHLVLMEGHLWGKKEITLPLSAVDHVEGDTVYLRLEKAQVELLPAIPLKRGYVAGQADIELVARVFDDPDRATEALEFVEELHRRRTVKVLNAAILAKDQQGNVSVKDTREIDAKKGRLLGAITGGLVGLLAGPGGAILGALAGLGAGGAAGKWIDEGFSDKFLQNLQQYLKPGSSALILLVEHQWLKPLSDEMSGLGGMVFQQALTDRLVEEFTGESSPEG